MTSLGISVPPRSGGPASILVVWEVGRTGAAKARQDRDDMAENEVNKSVPPSTGDRTLGCLRACVRGKPPTTGQRKRSSGYGWVNYCRRRSLARRYETGIRSALACR